MSSKIKILSVAGARPNFVKVSALVRAFEKYSKEFLHLLCHTGQHYDFNMSKIFFSELELPEPDFFLGSGSGTHAGQTAKIMLEFEKVLESEKPDLVMVYGDVNSTLACSLTAAKMHVPIAHVEAGLRSFDWKMPEEINRILTDRISDFLFVTEKSGIKNLKREGFAIAGSKEIGKKISSTGTAFLVGNVMIDSLVRFLPRASRSEVLSSLDLMPGGYILVTLHRPENVDDKKNLNLIFQFLTEISKPRKVVFPIHPRTRKNLENLSLEKKLNPNLVLIDPLGYLDFIKLMKESSLVITDSGGIQEETTCLGIPCVTIRDSTERPITVEIGTNFLAGTDLKKGKTIVNNILNGRIKKGKIPELWDGKAGERIVEILKKELGKRQGARVEGKGR